MTLKLIIWVLAIFGCIALVAGVIWLFNRSRSFPEWVVFLLQQLGKSSSLFATFLFLFLSPIWILYVIWGLSFKALVWGEEQLSSGWNYALIGLVFVFFFGFMIWTSKKGFLDNFGSSKKPLGKDKKSQKGLEEWDDLLGSYLQKGASLLIPLAIITALTLLGNTCFGALSAAWCRDGLADYTSHSSRLDVDAFSTFYFWHFCDLIPQIKVADTLGWENDIQREGSRAGFLLLLYKIIMAYIIIAKFYSWNKWRKALAKKTKATELV